MSAESLSEDCTDKICMKESCYILARLLGRGEVRPHYDVTTRAGVYSARYLFIEIVNSVVIPPGIASAHYVALVRFVSMRSSYTSSCVVLVLSGRHRSRLQEVSHCRYTRAV